MIFVALAMLGMQARPESLAALAGGGACLGARNVQYLAAEKFQTATKGSAIQPA